MSNKISYPYHCTKCGKGIELIYYEIPPSQDGLCDHCISDTGISHAVFIFLAMFIFFGSVVIACMI